MSWVFNPPQTEIEIGGTTYRLNTDWESCLWCWRAWQALEAKEISEACYAAIIADKMFLDPHPDIYNSKALALAGAYLNHFSDKDGERKTNIPPIDIVQDIEMIYRAFMSMGVNLRKQRIDYEEFQARLPELPEGCSYANIMRLRTLWYDKRSKMTKEDKELCSRIGWDKIKVRNRRAEKEQQGKEDDFKAIQNRKRAGRGLPPL